MKDGVSRNSLPRLENAGLQVCIDYRDFDAGTPSIVNMENAVETSRHTVTVLTPHWVQSEWSDFEGILTGISDPSGRGKKLVPIMLEDCKPPKRMSIFIWVDFKRKDREDIAWKQLLTALSHQKKDSQIVETLNNWLIAYPYFMPPHFTGRDAERSILTTWLEKDETNPLLILNALGGFGKSALVWHWLTQDLDARRWPKIVWWSFYEGDAIFDNFVKEILGYLKIRDSGRSTSPSDCITQCFAISKNPDHHGWL